MWVTECSLEAVPRRQDVVGAAAPAKSLVGALAALVGNSILPRLESLPGGRLGQLLRRRAIRDVPEPVLRHSGESLTGVNGAVGANAQIFAQAIAERADATVAGRHAATHRVDRADTDSRKVGQVALEHADEQFAVRRCSQRPTVRTRFPDGRHRNVEADIQALPNKKVEYLACSRHRPSGERTDRTHVQTVLARQLDSGHRPAKISLAALRVGDRLGPVEARPDGDAVLEKELTKLIVEQPQIGLQREANATRSELLFQQGEGASVKADSRDERLAAMKGQVQAPIVGNGLLPAGNRFYGALIHRATALMGAEAVAAMRGASQRRHDHQVSGHVGATLLRTLY